jgi:pimeloyl-ACP methyl ester carboxylesterase
MFRKSSLLIAVFLLSAGFSPAPAEAEPPAPGITDKPTIVIVHGAWGGSWAFKEVESLLREKGYNVYRPSLTGQGERVHLASPEINLSTHIEDVVNVFLFEELNDVVLVGHSYGGMVITGVADRLYDRIRSMIYLDAFVPHDGESLFSIQGEGASGIRQMEENGFLIPPWVQADQPPPSDVPHPVKTLSERLELINEEAIRQIPTTYIHAVEEGVDPEDDGFAAQAQRARDLGWPVLIIESDHNPQWSAPERLAEMLHENSK